MGEMADFELDNAFAELEHYTQHENAPIEKQYGENIVDEDGVTIGNPFLPPIPDK